MADGAVLLRRTGSRLEVVFNRPERHNAFTSATYEALLAVCAGLADRPDVRTVVFRGAGGRAFAAGNEISEFVSLTEGADGVAYEAKVGRVLRAVAELPQVTLAAVDGICVGGGLAVATHCDLRVCSEGSRFGYPIARTLGNALSAFIVYRCAAVFGESLTREMLLTSRLVTAERAYAVGAVMAVLPSEELNAEVDRVVDGIEAAAPLTLAATKEQLLRRSDAIEASPADDLVRLDKVYGSADFREGVRAFLAKEKPRFGRL
ncbi:enoyl-CoA hydratase/isomerase family protein [Nocardioides sp. WL0053]|uniref:Enoyl-CoA hydratase/isomerase family protein n=1 Tax=Nocardioides jiangsuensis TaxID=2866161 RepID=A0ABS7RJ21_9ACTN|nr:enoyl-CoA hydratase/isomerase family protein [Nocardioides jiangsuensis]